jgi:hypothetical protein
LPVGPRTPELVEAVRGEILWRLAGPAAQSHFDPHADPSAFKSDLEQAHGWARMLVYDSIVTHDRIAETVDALWDEARGVVAQHWAAVQAVQRNSYCAVEAP